jgi:hypothetical protein
MFTSEILEIVIGLVFIYLLLSLLGTTISEIIAGLLSMRGKLLKKSLKYLLDDHDKEILFGKFVEHPMFIKLSRDSKKKYPSYMSDSKFSKILLEALLEKRSLPNSKGINEMLGNLVDGPTKETLISIWSEAEEDLSKFRKGLEDWFNEVQARATGWYKKNVQVLLVIIGFIIALAFNADTLEMVNKLSVDSKARKNLVELAIKQVILSPDLAANMSDDGKFLSDCGIFAFDLKPAFKYNYKYINGQRTKALEKYLSMVGSPTDLQEINNLDKTYKTILYGSKDYATYFLSDHRIVWVQIDLFGN